MGLIGLLIGVILLIIFFIYSYLSNSPAVITPEKSEEIQTQAQDAVNSEKEKNKLEQNQIKNIDSQVLE